MLSDHYPGIYELVWKSDQLEKRAEASNRPQDLAEKAATDLAIMARVKAAVDWSAIGSALKGGAGKAGKGALYGLGAAVPIGAGGASVGSHLIDNAEEAAERRTADMRNKALQVALGVGATGAGLMGLHHLLASRRTDQQQQQPESEAVDLQQTSPEELLSQQGLTPADYYGKYGSAQEDDLLEKLSTVAYLDTILEGCEANQHDKTASELRVQNAEPGADILRHLLL